MSSAQPPPSLSLPPKPETSLPPPPPHLSSPTTPIRSERDKHYAPSSSSWRGGGGYDRDRDERAYRPGDMRDSYRPYSSRPSYDYDRDRDSRPYYDERDRRDYRPGDRDRNFRPREPYYPSSRRFSPPPYDDRRYQGRYRGRSRSRSPPPRRRRRSSSRRYDRSLSPPRSIDSRRRSRSPPSRRFSPPPSRFGRRNHRRSRTPPPSRSKPASPDRRRSPSHSGSSEDGEEGEVMPSHTRRRSRPVKEERRPRSHTPTPKEAAPTPVTSSRIEEPRSRVPTPPPPKVEVLQKPTPVEINEEVPPPKQESPSTQGWTPLSSHKGKQKEEPAISQLTEVQDVKMEDATAPSPSVESPVVVQQYRPPPPPRQPSEAGPSTFRQDHHLQHQPPRPPSTAPTGPRIRTNLPINRAPSSSGARSPMPAPSPVPSMRPLQSNAAASSSSSPRGVDITKSISAGPSPNVTSKPLPGGGPPSSTVTAAPPSRGQLAEEAAIQEMLTWIPEWKEDWMPWQPPSKTALLPDWSCTQFRRRIMDTNERVENLEKEYRRAKLQLEMSSIDLRAAEMVRLAAERHLEQAKFGFLGRPGPNDEQPTLAS